MTLLTSIAWSQGLMLSHRHQKVIPMTPLLVWFVFFTKTSHLQGNKKHERNNKNKKKTFKARANSYLALNKKLYDGQKVGVWFWVFFGGVFWGGGVVFFVVGWLVVFFQRLA